ncbi:hypothetical protein Tco_0884424 [Tanacetum coccineum]
MLGDLYSTDIFTRTLAPATPAAARNAISQRPNIPDNIKDKVDEVEKPYEWAHDEWYYEEEIEDYKYWKAEEEKAANEQRLLKLAKKHKKQLASMSRLNSFDDQSYDDLFQSDKENFEALDYEDAHLGMSFERSPKIALLDS